MTSAFHYSETSAFSPITYDIYECIPPPSTNSISIDLLSPINEYENRQAQQNFVDQWVANLHQSNYEPGLPFSLLAYPYLHECLGEPGFIRKRNERERMRVRNVNEGYARLRDHLPLEPTEKRLSKVETLRGAIKYIRLLETLLKDQESPSKDRKENAEEEKQYEKMRKSYSEKDSTRLA
uniref:Transcription factor Ash2 n=1 Tax=Podocoryna carnea TaxID=6096 RepID=Q6W8W2_PODCA|nr:transcription factor Ash2 [Podocoryna carnea]